MTVSKTPIAFTDLPRQIGSNRTDTVAVEGPLATAIDANFTGKLKPWADAMTARLNVTRQTSCLTFSTGWTWYSTAGLYCDAIKVGDLRFISLLVKYTGATLTADDYGGITDQKMGTFTDAAFRPGGTRTINVTGVATTGTAIFQLRSDGTIWMCGCSYRGVQFRSGNYALVTAMYIPSGE